MTPMRTLVTAAPGHARQRRSLLGLRHTPGRIALAVFRTPLFLYRRGWGRVLGRTFMLLVHVGRKTGQPHETVAMVLGDDRETGEVVICSGWGPDVDWLRNLHAGPAQEVRIGHDRFAPQHRFLTEDEAFAVAVRVSRSASAPHAVDQHDSRLGRPAARQRPPCLRHRAPVRRLPTASSTERCQRRGPAMTTVDQTATHSPLLDAVLNLSRYHREHEKFYATAPRERAVALQRHARDTARAR